MLFLAALPNLELQRAPAVSWAVAGSATVPPGGGAAYTVTWLGQPLAEGEALSIDVTLTPTTKISGTLAAHLTAALTAGILAAGNRLTWSRGAARSLRFVLPILPGASGSHSVAIANPSKGMVSPVNGSVLTTIAGG